MTVSALAANVLSFTSALSSSQVSASRNSRWLLDADLAPCRHAHGFPFHPSGSVCDEMTFAPRLAAMFAVWSSDWSSTRMTSGGCGSDDFCLLIDSRSCTMFFSSLRAGMMMEIFLESFLADFLGMYLGFPRMSHHEEAQSSARMGKMASMWVSSMNDA